MTKKFFEDTKFFKDDKFFKDEKFQDKEEKDKSVLSDEALEGIAGGAPKTPPVPTPDPKTQPGGRR